MARRRHLDALVEKWGECGRVFKSGKVCDQPRVPFGAACDMCLHNDDLLRYRPPEMPPRRRKGRPAPTSSGPVAAWPPERSVAEVRMLMARRAERLASAAYARGFGVVEYPDGEDSED